MSHGGPLHRVSGKSVLALHCTEDHEVNGRVVSTIWPPLPQLRRLSLEQLERMHRELHEPAPARVAR